MALISLADFTDRYEKTLDVEGEARVATLIDDASALVVQIVNDSDVTDVWKADGAPSAVVPVLVSMVRRAIDNPEGVSQKSVGDASMSWGSGGSSRPSEALYLTTNERRIVRRAAGTDHTSMTLESPYTGTSTVDLAL